MGLKSVFSFSDYREFLRAYYDYKKEVVPGFTYERFSKQAGLNSPNYLKLVIDGKRNLTVANIHEFARALELTSEEHPYFEALVLLNQAKGEIESKYYSGRLKALKRGKPLRIGKSKLQRTFASWYFPAVYLLLKDAESETAIASIARRLRLSEDQVQGIVGQLIQNNTVKVSDGRYRIEFEHLTFFDKRDSNQIQKDFLMAQLNLSLEAFKRTYATDGKFYSHTFSIERSNSERYVEKLKALLTDITADCQDEPTERLLQLNIQLFPIGE